MHVPREMVKGVHDVHRVLVVGVGEDHELGHQGKALEGELQLTHAAVVVQMVVVDVQHDGEVGGQLQEGLGELAGFFISKKSINASIGFF